MFDHCSGGPSGDRLVHRSCHRRKPDTWPNPYLQSSGFNTPCTRIPSAEDRGLFTRASNLSEDVKANLKHDARLQRGHEQYGPSLLFASACGSSIETHGFANCVTNISPAIMKPLPRQCACLAVSGLFGINFAFV